MLNNMDFDGVSYYLKQSLNDLPDRVLANRQSLTRSLLRLNRSIDRAFSINDREMNALTQPKPEGAAIAVPSGMPAMPPFPRAFTMDSRKRDSELRLSQSQMWADAAAAIAKAIRRNF